MFSALPRIHFKQVEQTKSSLYDSEPRLANLAGVSNRYYSSMNDVQARHQVHSASTTNSNRISSINYPDCDISYEVDSPRTQIDATASGGYLNAFLLKKRQEEEREQQHQTTVQQLIAQFEKPTTTRRPLSAPLVDPTNKPTKGILHRRANGSMTPILNKPPRKRSKSVTFECHREEMNITSSTDEEKMNNLLDHPRSPRINIGITLDSRLRKTPVLDMLRSTTMESDLLELRQLNRTSSFRQTVLPIARF